MRKVITFIAALLIAGNATATEIPASKRLAEPQFVPGQLIVRYREGTTREQRQMVRRRLLAVGARSG